MAGGQHHAGIRMEFPDSKGDFRSGARTVEQVNVTTQVRADFCAEFGKVTGKVARVVSDDQAGLPARALGVLSDQFVWEGVYVPFFGKVTGTTPLPALLRKRAGARTGPYTSPGC